MLSGDDDLEFGRGPLPHPLDRLWLHPSELSPLAAATVGDAAQADVDHHARGRSGRRDPDARRPGCGRRAGAAPPNTAPSRASVPTSTPIATARAVAIAVADSVVAVSARDKHGTRRGSGVCIRKADEILTSDRLVGDATKIEVTTADGVVQPARVIGRDSTTDLVLLGVAADGPAPAVTGPTGADRRRPARRAARPVRGAGRSRRRHGLGSRRAEPRRHGAVDEQRARRLHRQPRRRSPSGPTTSGLLETAAASSSGSTGGALVDHSGNVTGIVLSPVGDDRMTYAVPISTALAVATDLRTHGYAIHGALGISGVNNPDGPTVSGVIADGPAAHAGVHVGDVIDVGRRSRGRLHGRRDGRRAPRSARPAGASLALERGATALKVRVTLDQHDLRLSLPAPRGRRASMGPTVRNQGAPA